MIKNFVARFKKAKQSFGAMGEMILQFEVQNADFNTINATLDIVEKSKASESLKNQMKSFINQHRARIKAV